MMLEAMRELALLDLNHRCKQSGLDLTAIRAQHGEHITPLLVEDSEKIASVYLLQSVIEQPGVVKMWIEEITPAKARKLPFVMSRVAAFGPVMKRSRQPNGAPGPTLSTQELTKKSFAERGQEQESWGAYFQEMHDVLFNSHTLILADHSYSVGAEYTDPHVLAAAIRLIPEKKTVFIAVIDAKGRWPGECAEYHAYLAQTLANKYITGAAAAHKNANCPLCGANDVTVYPNLRGTGINFSNMDRAGAFSGLETSQAWKGYGLCLDCADLLYIFKNHLLSQQFTGFVAGDKALLLPSLLGNESGKRRFLEDWHKYLNAIAASSKLDSIEKDLLEFVQDQDDAQVVVHILWATFGQVVDDVRGVVTDVLPSRLRELAKRSRAVNQWQHSLAPRYSLPEADFDLHLNMLSALLKRPGGKRASKANDSSQLFTIKRQLVEAIYHGQPLGAAAAGLWRELLITARCYLDDAVNSGNSWGLIFEGYSEKGSKQTRSWTLAGWVKHLARLLYYLDNTGVLLMTPPTEPLNFAPTLLALQPYFQPGSGLNSRDKAFTFLLGILYGKVLQVQAARGVNVTSNALTWLKRLNLDGRELPELYCKIREKLLSYGVEASADVRAIVHDLGRLGGQSLGDQITLDQTATCYFLLLGQSVTVDVLPSKAKSTEE